VRAYAVADLRELVGRYDWRFSLRNLWRVEQALIDYPHRPIRTSEQRIDRLRARYVAFRAKYPDRKPLFYEGRDRWTAIPKGSW
jgi:hypothetical protein